MLGFAGTWVHIGLLAMFGLAIVEGFVVAWLLFLLPVLSDAVQVAIVSLCLLLPFIVKLWQVSFFYVEIVLAFVRISSSGVPLPCDYVPSFLDVTAKRHFLQPRFGVADRFTSFPQPTRHLS